MESAISELQLNGLLDPRAATLAESIEAMRASGAVNRVVDRSVSWTEFKSGLVGCESSGAKRKRDNELNEEGSSKIGDLLADLESSDSE